MTAFFTALVGFGFDDARRQPNALMVMADYFTQQMGSQVQTVALKKAARQCVRCSVEMIDSRHIRDDNSFALSSPQRDRYNVSFIAAADW